LLQTVPITELSYEEVGLRIRLSATVYPSDEVDVSFDFSLKQITRVLDFSSNVFQPEGPGDRHARPARFAAGQARRVLPVRETASTPCCRKASTSVPRACFHAGAPHARAEKAGSAVTNEAVYLAQLRT
jgi:hypothetical protein